MSDEARRIKAVYAERARTLDPEFYALDREPMLFAHQGRERALRDALSRAGLLPLGARSLLELGCGTGEWFASFERFGLSLDRLAGVDLDEDRVAAARARAPRAEVKVADAAALPWPDQRFDVVFQATVFSSILDAGVRRAVAAEMRRVLRPGGAVIWYDFSYDNPSNRDVRGVKLGELGELFPGWNIDARRVTLAPPLARRLVPLSWALSTVLESATVLNTHLMAVIRR